MASQVNGSGIEIYLVGRRSRRLKAVVARFKWLTLGLFGGHEGKSRKQAEFSSPFGGCLMGEC